VCERDRNTHRDRETKHEWTYSIEPVGMEGIVERGVKEVDYLAEERAGAQFHVHSMKIFLAGGQHEYEVSTRIANLVANDPVPLSVSLSLSLSQLVNVSPEFSSGLQDEIMPALKHIRSEIVLAQ
jgi:hypothetical protein